MDPTSPWEECQGICGPFLATENAMAFSTVDSRQGHTTTGADGHRSSCWELARLMLSP